MFCVLMKSHRAAKFTGTTPPWALPLLWLFVIACKQCWGDKDWHNVRENVWKTTANLHEKQQCNTYFYTDKTLYFTLQKQNLWRNGLLIFCQGQWVSFTNNLTFNFNMHKIILVKDVPKFVGRFQVKYCAYTLSEWDPLSIMDISFKPKT